MPQIPATILPERWPTTRKETIEGYRARIRELQQRIKEFEDAITELEAQERKAQGQATLLVDGPNLG